MGFITVLYLQPYAGKSSGHEFSSSPAPLKCTNTMDEFFRFPFLLNGNLHWDCVKNEAGHPVCNINIPEDAGYNEVQEFSSTDSFVPCKVCDSCSIVRANYGAYVLQNGLVIRYSGVSSKEECQVLCQIAKNCNYFKYKKEGPDSDEQVCFLKDGLGKFHEVGKTKDTSFGPKFCPGKISYKVSLDNSFIFKSIL